MRNHAATVLTLLVVSAFCFAEKPSGFAGIPFGTVKQTVVWSLITIFDMIPKGSVAAPPAWSPEWNGRVFSATYWSRKKMDLYIVQVPMELTGYTIGNRRYDVLLHFNKNNRFCGYTLRGESGLEDEVDSGLRQDYLFLAELLESRHEAARGAIDYNSGRIVGGARAWRPIKAGPDLDVVVSLCPVKGFVSSAPRYAPVAEIWHTGFLNQARVERPVELTPSECRQQIQSCVSAHQRNKVSALARAL